MNCKFCGRPAHLKVKMIPVCRDCRDKVRKVRDMANENKEIKEGVGHLTLKQVVAKLESGCLENY